MTIYLFNILQKWKYDCKQMNWHSVRTKKLDHIDSLTTVHFNRI